MTIHLVAQNPDLHKLCREILADLPDSGPACSLFVVAAKDGWKEADLHIWDFHPDLEFPVRPHWSPLRHIFLVERKDLPTFYQRAGRDQPNVLLKPVNRATLATFLIPAASNGSARSLRADRDEILQCLIQTNLKLQEYDQDRTTFLARAVHDFRAPLTALSGYCGLLLSEPLGPLNDSQCEVLRRMQNSAKRLSHMATAMFALSVGRQVKRLPDLKPGDIRECVDQALHEIAPFADEKSISIELDLEPCSDRLWFEPGQIEQLLVNLLDNACKFTPKVGCIEIRGYPYFWERRSVGSTIPATAERRRKPVFEPNSYRIDISDSGTAIPEEQLQKIFEEYTTYAGGRDRSGGGLGLAICKMIVAQHDGRVWANNTQTGPQFSVVLPMHSLSVAPYEVRAGHDSDASVGGIVHADR